MNQRAAIPVIDLFAGPGGLGDGFASRVGLDGGRSFEVRVSIEKDATAHQTLSLRALCRSFDDGAVPDCYYDYARGQITREELFSHPAMAGRAEAALAEARHAELGKTPHQTIDGWIRKAIGDASEWVLIGGPPCQAYSMAGRSRLRPNNEEKFEKDERHLLYKEYLRVIRLFGPSVFVMENVKGLLTSRHEGSPIFDRILADLLEPGGGASYEIRSLVAEREERRPADYLIESENYGVPQCRHRVILFGVRSDIAARMRVGERAALRFELKTETSKVSVATALAGIPAIRSRLSAKGDSHDAWLSVIKEAPQALKGWRQLIRAPIEEAMGLAYAKARSHEFHGAPYAPSPALLGKGMPAALRTWLADPRLEGIAQHESRAHMPSDLHRYLFASCFAKLEGYSPKLRLFPPKLLPLHGNVSDEIIPFMDRFKVQVADQPSSTVVSHICKDGHYFIHPDPSQCRSLTVREAARLQTFPDNYFFEGTRTQQYHQVGNAVPPFLARQIAEVVADFMAAARR